MKIDLSPEEQRHLIWQEGDYFETIRGVITFTAMRNVVSSVSADETVQRTFFFKDTETGFWGEQEWTACVRQEMPNGPALLVLLRRGERACVFGVISLANGSWSHAWPLTTILHYRKSSRRRRMVIWGKLMSVLLVPVALLASALVFVSLFMWVQPLLSMGEKLKESWRGVPRKEVLEVEKSARVLMHRLAASANQPDEQGRL